MNNVKKLVVLANNFQTKVAEKRDQYGGIEFELPPDHKAMMVLKNGGFSCANCRFVNAEKHECNNEYYIKWNGSKKLPDAPLDKICSDWFMSSKE